MAEVTFISGGARSGKSRLAEQLAERHGAPLGYLATGSAGDGEMQARIARHQARRGDQWTTIEEPRELLAALRAHDGRYRAVLVDCITLWLSNLLLAHGNAEQPLAAVRALAAALPELATPVILVSNEVGLGIVPDNPLARSFRDLAGEANQLLAAAADQVYVVFSGLPLQLK